MAMKKSGSTNGKSNAKGMGGRAEQMRMAMEKKGLPASEIGGIIGKQARKDQTAPGQRFFHNPSGKKKGGKK
jgi:hypothetical protein